MLLKADVKRSLVDRERQLAARRVFAEQLTEHERAIVRNAVVATIEYVRRRNPTVPFGQGSALEVLAAIGQMMEKEQ